MTDHSTTPEPTYEQFLGARIDGLSDSVALKAIAMLVDMCDAPDRGPGTDLAIQWCEELDKRDLSDADRAYLDYYRANAHACHLARRLGTDLFAWDSSDLAEQIFYLRRALNRSAFDALASGRRCQILTNLANQLSHAGRISEAIELWTRALEIHPTFWMALGNRGCGKIAYAKALFDRGHRVAMALGAHDDLTAALAAAEAEPQLGHSEALEGFRAKKAEIEGVLDIDRVRAKVQVDESEFGKTEEEQAYRRWALGQRLFLNPLNDAHSKPAGSYDPLTLPDITLPLDAPPSRIGFFNQIKQEFASARWFYYEGTNSTDVHFSDRDVLLLNTLDYPAYGLNVEKVRVAFRSTYSLFDKLAFFLNDYLDLKIPLPQVNFRSIWREKPTSPIRSEIRGDNSILRGLYWLSKDLVDDRFKETSEPDARELARIRNVLEHRYLKVHEFTVPKADKGSPLGWLVDDLAHSVLRRDFEQKTLRLLKLARAAIIYLVLAVHREEQRAWFEADAKAGADGLESFIGVLPIDHMDDDWKR